MLLSILVYGLTAAALCLLGCHAMSRDIRYEQLNTGRTIGFFHSWEILLSIFILAVIAGARWHTGYDHEMYLEEYHRLIAGQEMVRDRFEPGFIWVSKAFAYFKVHYFFYFAFWAMLQAGFLYYALRERKFLLPWVGLNIMLGVYFLNWCNSMRQAVCVCLFVAMIPLIVKRSWRNFVFYLLLVIAATLLHRSAWLLLPLYLLTFVKSNLNIKSWVCFLVLAICIGLGFNPGWWFKPLMQLITPVLKLFSYDVYQEDGLLPMLLNDGFRFAHFGPSRISLLLVDIFIIYYYQQVKRYFRDDKNLQIYFLLAFIGMCLENMFMNTSHFILRPTEYFLIFVLIMNAYTMAYLWKNKRFMAIVLALITYTYVFFLVFKATYMPERVTIPFLYHFFFLPQF